MSVISLPVNCFFYFFVVTLRYPVLPMFLGGGFIVFVELIDMMLLSLIICILFHYFCSCILVIKVKRYSIRALFSDFC